MRRHRKEFPVIKIAMTGAALVGRAFGFGCEVVRLDKAQRKMAVINRGELPICEPGFYFLMMKDVKAGTSGSKVLDARTGCGGPRFREHAQLLARIGQKYAGHRDVDKSQRPDQTSHFRKAARPLRKGL